MAAEKFGRKYRLTIGGTNITGSTTNLTKSVVITESNIEFDIKTTKKSKLNTLELKIYNLSKSTIAIFDVKDVLVTLEVGYGDGPYLLLFKGDKTHMRTQNIPPDVCTTVIAAEGYVSVREGAVQTTSPEGSTVKQVISAIIKAGFPEIKNINITGAGADKKYNKGYSAAGHAKSQLDDICKANDLEWNIEKNETLNVFSKKGDIKVKSLVISPSNGLISSPEKTSQDVRTLKNDLGVPPDSGIRFECLLNPLVRAGAVVTIQGTFAADGNYLVNEVSHRGCYEDNEWTTIIEGTVY
jgi:hypothetical protein